MHQRSSSPPAPPPASSPLIVESIEQDTSPPPPCPSEQEQLSPLLTLPPRLRFKIWTLALEEKHLSRCTRPPRPKHASGVSCVFCQDRCPPFTGPPALLAINRQIRLETIPMWFGRTTFYFHDGKAVLLRFLDMLDNDCTYSIRTLRNEVEFGRRGFAVGFLREVHALARQMEIEIREDAVEVCYWEGKEEGDGVVIRGEWREDEEKVKEEEKEGDEEEKKDEMQRNRMMVEQNMRDSASETVSEEEEDSEHEP